MWRWSNVVIISASLGILVLPESVMWVIFTDCAFPHLERSRRILPSVNWPVEIAPGNILYCISYLYWHAGKDFIISCGKRGFTLFLRHNGTPGSGLFFSFTYWLMNNKTYMIFFFFMIFLHFLPNLVKSHPPASSPRKGMKVFPSRHSDPTLLSAVFCIHGLTETHDCLSVVVIDRGESNTIPPIQRVQPILLSRLLVTDSCSIGRNWTHDLLTIIDDF